MAFETKPGQGALFKNTRKEKPTHPDYQGDAVCPLCKAALKISGWLRETKKGMKYFSLSFKGKGTGYSEADDDEIPF